MIKNITFCADDFIFIENLQTNNPALEELSQHLKETILELSVDDTVCLELPEPLIEQVIAAEKEWFDDSGIINHIAIQFVHDNIGIQ